MYNLATRVRERFEATGQDIYLVGETAVGWNGMTWPPTIQNMIS